MAVAESTGTASSAVPAALPGHCWRPVAPPGQGRALSAQWPGIQEGAFAAMKAGLVPVNTNYRYRGRGAAVFRENADVEAVIYGACFSSLVRTLSDRLPVVRSGKWGHAITAGGCACL
ncbi:MAG: hypothetical protein R3E83_02235 [Burkholderiaceae bacterium]